MNDSKYSSSVNESIDDLNRIKSSMVTCQTTCGCERKNGWLSQKFNFYFTFLTNGHGKLCQVLQHSYYSVCYQSYDFSLFDSG